jgi:TDG/mug DNA glycosylase family protein
VDSRSFPPIAGRDARVLILGSLPGQESLRQRKYYAQPRNAFWPIMGALFGAAPALPYAERRRLLLANGVAVWDVCARAFRAGSLDSAIVASSVVPNDFAAFFAAHLSIAQIFFNGAKAAELYRRRVVPALPPPLRVLPAVVLPSTSPAYAALDLAAKIRRWTVTRTAYSTADAGRRHADPTVTYPSPRTRRGMR